MARPGTESSNPSSSSEESAANSVPASLSSPAQLAVLDVSKYQPRSVYTEQYGNFDDSKAIDLYQKMLHETDPAKQRVLMHLRNTLSTTRRTRS
jgi:hypothetical protein